jgi:hypothetical protein
MVGYSLGGWFGLLTALGGDELDTQWKVYEAVNGVPPPQVSCEIEDGTAHVDAFVGYGGAYSMVNQEEDTDADFVSIVNIKAHMGENSDLVIRAIQGIHDSILSVEIIKSSKALITAFADAGYDAVWLEVDGGHGFGASGELWDHNRQVIMDAARP